MSKNTAVWNWLKTYPDFEKLFYNFCIAEDGNQSFIPNPTDFVIKQDILGNKLKYYDFAVTCFSSFSDIPFSDENVIDYNAMQDFILWIDSQNKNKLFPDFGENCIIEKVENLQNIPSSSAINQEMAKYMVQCRIVYEEFNN